MAAWTPPLFGYCSSWSSTLVLALLSSETLLPLHLLQWCWSDTFRPPIRRVVRFHYNDTRMIHCRCRVMVSLDAIVHHVIDHYAFANSELSCTLDSACVYLASCWSEERCCLYADGMPGGIPCSFADGQASALIEFVVLSQKREVSWVPNLDTLYAAPDLIGVMTSVVPCNSVDAVAYMPSPPQPFSELADPLSAFQAVADVYNEVLDPEKWVEHIGYTAIWRNFRPV